MAKDINDARDMHRAWQTAGTVAVVDAFSQWIPALAKSREMLDAGYIGKPLGGSCRFNMTLFNRPDPGFPYNWFSKAGLGVSSIRNNGSHLIHLLGPVDELVADDSLVLKEWVFANGDKLIPQNNDCANVLLRFAFGMVMPIQVCWTAAQAEGWARSMGNRWPNPIDLTDLSEQQGLQAIWWQARRKWRGRTSHWPFGTH